MSTTFVSLHSDGPHPHQSNPQSIQAAFACIADRYDLANHLLSGGLDFLWRARAAAWVQRWRPERILDLATGSGDLAAVLARACPHAEVHGADFCLPMLLHAQAKKVERLVVADALRLPYRDNVFDVITVGFGLRNMQDWEAALREMQRVLRPGGHLLALDFSQPYPVLRPFYRLYLHHLLPRIAGLLTGDRTAYEYLGTSIEAFPSGEKMRALFAACDFHENTVEPLTGGIVTLYTGQKPR